MKPGHLDADVIVDTGPPPMSAAAAGSCALRGGGLLLDCAADRRPQIRRELQVSRLSILREFAGFLRVRKKWWLTPIVVLLVLLGALLVLTQGSALAPFIYALF